MTLTLTADNDERVGVIGQTRMGKTFLMERLLEQQPRVIVVDPKHRIAWKGYHMTDSPLGALQRDKVIYRPADTGIPPDDFWWTAAEDLHDRGGGIIYIDELSVVCSDSRVPKGLAKTVRLGGELGVGVWWAAQESTSIHNTMMRQCEQLILFYNQGASDRDKITRIVGDMGEATAKLREYQFVVFVRGETYDNEAIPVYKVNP